MHISAIVRVFLSRLPACSTYLAGAFPVISRPASWRNLLLNSAQNCKPSSTKLEQAERLATVKAKAKLDATFLKGLNASARLRCKSREHRPGKTQGRSDTNAQVVCRDRGH